MDSLTLILLSGVIPLYLCASSSDCDDKTQYFEGGKCCFKCGPGSFLAAKCNSNKYSSCEPCQRGFYQPVWTMEDHCQPHTVCDSKGGFEIMQVGDGVRNVQCLCKQGMHCPNKDCEICEHDTACPPGQGVKIPGDRKFQATTCEDCETGFYSNVTSLTEPCKKWMDCSSFSLIEVRAGTTQSDVECGIPYQSNESYKVAIGFLAVLLILCIALFICSRLGYLDQVFDFIQRKKENDPERVAQETHPGDPIHSPEMEQGGSISMHAAVQEVGKDSRPSEEEGQTLLNTSDTSYVYGASANGNAGRVCVD
ncbi:tumor necrosis factor receptor superfamily member 5-like isoform X1 [Rhincodon typus]|uniref:tumor necrosis factor receptor superfamily member 5-like isoform X1 n=1 Tax=Rhincodon typus TaxID=259920 RepID=UPI0009A3E7A0|nr:tumor necrosis factor receptor superfamily member 5-like isoform X1 [Rhincodon typus]